MKKVLVILLVLIIMLITAIAVFLATFDANRYNNAIASKVGSVVGNPVEIGRISLKWDRRLLLGVENFKIFEEKDGVKTPGLSFERGDMALELLPLLNMQLKVSSVSISGLSIHIVRAKDGVIKVRGYDPKTTAGSDAVKSSTGLAAAPAVVNFNIGSITVKNSAVRFQDFMMEPEADISIDAIEADIRDVSLNGPVQFDVKMALFSSKQNVTISGAAGGFVAGPMYIKDMDTRLDLSAVDRTKLLKAVPAMLNTPIQEGPSGLLKASVSEIRIANGKIEKFSAGIELNDGRVLLSTLKVPVENIRLSASALDDKISVKSFSASLANATLKSSADIVDLFKEPKTSLHLDADIPEVKPFFSSVVGGKQYIDGKITLSFDGMMSGASQEAILKTLSGKGIFALDNGAVLDMNLLKQSLGAIAIFPGLTDTVSPFLPANIKDMMDQEYTLLKPVRQSIAIKDGIVDLPDLMLETDFADVSGAASLTLRGELTGNGVIRFSQEVSDGIIKAVAQMRYLADEKNIIEFPITFKASGGGASVMPDLQYIGKKVAMQKGQEIVADILKKATKSKAPAQSGTVSSDEKNVSDFGNILDSVKAMARQEQNTASQ
jgi:Uncharacterized protein involved in outer membrane biogenesis